MNILAVDSSKEQYFSVATLRCREIVFSRVVEDRFSKAFFPLLLSREEEAIDLLAVNIGPGSYTGIRASIAALAGMSLHTKTKFIGFDSFSILLNKFRRSNCKPLSTENTISVLLKGYNNSFFYLKKFNGNFEEQANPVRMACNNLKALHTDILLTNIQGCGDCYEILAEDLGLLALEEMALIKESTTVVPLYI